MRHKRSGFKLKRDAGSRNSLLKNLVTSVIEHERIVTTVPKAKAARPLVEKMITLAKRDTLHTRRQAAAFLETPAWFAWAGARAMEPNRLCSSWLDPSSSNAPQNAPSAAKNA